MRPQRRRRSALRLEVEELAALVAEIGDDAEQKAEQRESECDERRGRECRQRAARERLRLEVAEHSTPGRHLEDVERRPAQGGVDPRLLAARSLDPDLVWRACARCTRVERGRERPRVGEDGVAVDGRNAAGGCDDLRRDRPVPDLDRQDPARPCRVGERLCHDHRDRVLVGRLPGAEPRDGTARDDVVEPAAADVGDPTGAAPRATIERKRLAVDAGDAEPHPSLGDRRGVLAAVRHPVQSRAGEFERERDEPAAASAARDRRGKPPCTSRSERDAACGPERRHDHRADGEIVTASADGECQRPPIRRNRDASQYDLAAGPDQSRQRPRRARRVVAPPTQARQRVGRDPEDID